MNKNLIDGLRDVERRADPGEDYLCIYERRKARGACQSAPRQELLRIPSALGRAATGRASRDIRVSCRRHAPSLHSEVDQTKLIQPLKENVLARIRRIPLGSFPLAPPDLNSIQIGTGSSRLCSAR
jgi:hypothetical protein